MMWGGRVGALFGPAGGAVGGGILLIPSDTPKGGRRPVAADRPWRKLSRWKVITRCTVNKQKDCYDCPSSIGAWTYGGTFRDAEKRAQRDANKNLGSQGSSGCQARHCDPVQCFQNGKQVGCPRGRPRVK